MNHQYLQQQIERQLNEAGYPYIQKPGLPKMYLTPPMSLDFDGDTINTHTFHKHRKVLKQTQKHR